MGNETMPMVLCTGTPQNSYADAANLVNAVRNHDGYDSYANNWNNSPFAYMMIMATMRFLYGNDWQNQMAGNAEMQSRFNQLTNQISDNHNTQILSELARGNYARIGELAASLNVDLRAIQSGICDMRQGIQMVDGDVKFTGERIINGNLLGLKDLQGAMKDCCCQQKELTQRMGYENMLGQKDLLASLQQGHNMLGYQMQQGFDRTNTGLERGFSNIGFITEQQTCRIEKAISEASQRQIDTMNMHWNQDLRDKLAQMSQDAQTANIVNQLRNNGCGCNC